MCSYRSDPHTHTHTQKTLTYKLALTLLHSQAHTHKHTCTVCLRASCLHGNKALYRSLEMHISCKAWKHLIVFASQPNTQSGKELRPLQSAFYPFCPFFKYNRILLVTRPLHTQTNWSLWLVSLSPHTLKHKLHNTVAVMRDTIEDYILGYYSIKQKGYSICSSSYFTVAVRLD